MYKKTIILKATDILAVQMLKLIENVPLFFFKFIFHIFGSMIFSYFLFSF
jgi:hypothetical protein